MVHVFTFKVDLLQHIKFSETFEISTHQFSEIKVQRFVVHIVKKSTKTYFCIDWDSKNVFVVCTSIGVGNIDYALDMKTLVVCEFKCIHRE